jgi:hypothetical protein
MKQVARQVLVIWEKKIEPDWQRKHALVEKSPPAVLPSQLRSDQYAH